MMYPFMVIEDNIEVVHSEIRPDNTIRVYFEQPIHGGFHSVECILPSYEWKNNKGFTKEELDYFDEFLHSIAHVIIEVAQEGDYEYAAGF